MYAKNLYLIRKPTCKFKLETLLQYVQNPLKQNNFNCFIVFIMAKVVKNLFDTIFLRTRFIKNFKLIVNMFELLMAFYPFYYFKFIDVVNLILIVHKDFTLRSHYNFLETDKRVKVIRFSICFTYQQCCIVSKDIHNLVLFYR